VCSHRLRFPDTRAPHRTAPHRTAPHRTAPQHNATRIAHRAGADENEISTMKEYKQYASTIDCQPAYLGGRGNG